MTAIRQLIAKAKSQHGMTTEALALALGYHSLSGLYSAVANNGMRQEKLEKLQQLAGASLPAVLAAPSASSATIVLVRCSPDAAPALRALLAAARYEFEEVTHGQG